MKTAEEAQAYLRDMANEFESKRNTLGQLQQAIQRGLPIPQVDYPVLLVCVQDALERMRKIDSGKATEEFHLIKSLAHGKLVARCPCCQKIPQIWERMGGEFATVKAVSCASGDPGMGLENGCPMYMPPEEFYKPTISAAVQIWNVWATYCAAEAGLPTPKLHAPGTAD